ncbi:MAG: hypothetical protein ACYTG7_00725 [Planctomycetota bacterium]|jgi:hypothetical protein
MARSKKIFLTALTLTVLLSVIAICAEYGGRWYGSGDGKTVPPIPTPYPVYIYPWHEWLGDIIDMEFRGTWQDEDNGDYGDFRGKVTWTSSKHIAHCKGKWTWMDPKGYLIPMGSFEMYFNYKTETCEGKWLNTHNQDSGGIKGIRLE